MGLLSRLSMFGQQSPWAVLAPQMQQAQQYPQQTQPSQDMVAAPRQTTAQLRPMTFTERFEGLMDNPLLQTGLSLLGNAQNGGDWGAVGRDMQAWGQQRRDRQRQDNEERRLAAADRRQETADQRAGRLFDFTVDDRTREAERRQTLDQWVATLPEDQQAAARANPQAAHAAYMEAQALAGQPMTPFQRAQLGLQARGMELDFAASAAAQELRQRSMSLRGPDRDLMETIRNSSGSANELLGLAQMFREANSRTPSGGGTEWLPFNGLSPDRASMRQIESMMRGMMRPVGSGATSDYEQRLYAQGVPRADLLGPQNQQVIQNIETLARIRNARRYFYEDYADANGTLNGAERAFQQSGEFRALQAQNPLERPRQTTRRSVTQMSDEELRRLAGE